MPLHRAGVHVCYVTHSAHQYTPKLEQYVSHALTVTESLLNHLFDLDLGDIVGTALAAEYTQLRPW